MKSTGSVCHPTPLAGRSCRRGAERSGPSADLVKGAVAGAVAWWAMDRVLMFLRARENSAARREEDRARNGIPALEVMGDRVAELAGVSLSDEERQRAGTALQWMVGVGTGALYGVLRPRYPSVRAARGLAYGAAFSLVVDESLVPLLGLAPGPAAFPWATHARGFLGHLAFGAVAEAALAQLDRIT